MKNKKYIVIKPKTSKILLDLREMWQYKELFYIFAWRDIKVRYKQTILGAGWAILQPLLSTFVFTIFFGNLIKVSSGDLPYPLFVLIGLVYWGFFSGVLSHASSSLIENEAIVKKVYFPREILPLSTVGANLIDFAVALVLLILVSLYFHFYPGPLFVLSIFLGIFVAILGAGGIGFFLAAFNIRYRDVRYILPFFIQMMVFLTPVIYPTTIMRPSFRYLIALNPMTGVIEMARFAFAGGGSLDISAVAISIASSVLLFIIGLYYFKSTEKFFADIL